MRAYMDFRKGEENCAADQNAKAITEIVWHGRSFRFMSKRFCFPGVFLPLTLDHYLPRMTSASYHHLESDPRTGDLGTCKHQSEWVWKGVLSLQPGQMGRSEPKVKGPGIFSWGCRATATVNQLLGKNWTGCCEPRKLQVLGWCLQVKPPGPKSLLWASLWSPVPPGKHVGVCESRVQ